MNAELLALQQKVSETGYIAEPSLLTSLWLMEKLQRPLLIEGDAGVGKTEIGKMLASAESCELIRLQCYEGLDIHNAAYEWNYQRQLLNIRRHEIEKSNTLSESQLFSRDYLLERPLLRAINCEKSCVLLIDEVDRADEEFEAYLLEILSDFQLSIPELGTVTALSIPRVVLTSNGTREISDALRRRCLYHFIDYPDYDKELRIIGSKLPNVGPQLAGQIAAFMQQLRREDIRKRPGIAETLDWAAALLQLDIRSLDDKPEAINATLGCLLKTREDCEAMPDEYLNSLIGKVV